MCKNVLSKSLIFQPLISWECCPIYIHLVGFLGLNPTGPLVKATIPLNTILGPGPTVSKHRTTTHFLCIDVSQAEQPIEVEGNQEVRYQVNATTNLKLKLQGEVHAKLEEIKRSRGEQVKVNLGEVVDFSEGKDDSGKAKYEAKPILFRVVSTDFFN